MYAKHVATFFVREIRVLKNAQAKNVHGSHSSYYFTVKSIHC